MWLSKKYEVELISFRSYDYRHADLEELKSLCSKVTIYDINAFSRFASVVSALNSPLLVAARASAAVRLKLKSAVDSGRIQRIHCEFSQMGQYLAFCGQVPERTLHLSDVASQWAQRRSSRGVLSGLFWKWEAKRTAACERAYCKLATRLYVPSQKDKELMTALDPTFAEWTTVIPLHFDRFVGHSGNPPALSEHPPKAVFLGALGRVENREAVKWIREHLAPRLLGGTLPVQFLVIGDDPSKKLRLNAPPNMRFTGYIEDLGAVFSQCHLAVLPLFEGAGVKVKVLESLAAGLPVITTAIGAEGIPASEDDGLIVTPPDPCTFAEAILRLLKDPDCLLRMSRRAIAWSGRQEQSGEEQFLAGR